MALHFTRAEYDRRIAATCEAMARQGLDGLLLFQQESMYYLTGYDTFGFCFFQCLYLGADGRLALLTRSADLRQAQHTSIISDIRIWTDAAGASPATQLRDMLQSLGCRGRRLGIENQSYGLTHFNGKLVDAALDGFARLTDASDLVNRIRVVKSPAELKHVRKAGTLGDAALKAAVRRTRSGADEGEILAAQQGAVFAGGGDYPANEFIIGSGRDAQGASRHGRSLPRGACRRRGTARARPYGRRCLRRPRPCHGRAWHARPPAQCLRLLPGRQVYTKLDGHAHVLQG